MMDGGKGYISYWIEEDEDFRVTSFGVSGMDNARDTGKLDMSTVQISVIVRNKDGSFTKAVYRAKGDLSFILDEV